MSRITLQSDLMKVEPRKFDIADRDINELYDILLHEYELRAAEYYLFKDSWSKKAARNGMLSYARLIKYVNEIRLNQE